MFVLRCLLAFTGVFLIARTRPKIKMDRVFFSMGQISSRLKITTVTELGAARTGQ